MSSGIEHRHPQARHSTVTIASSIFKVTLDVTFFRIKFCLVSCDEMFVTRYRISRRSRSDVFLANERKCHSNFLKLADNQIMSVIDFAAHISRNGQLKVKRPSRTY